MGQQVIGRGTVPNDGTGDTAYVFTGKINAMFTEVYAAISVPLVLKNQSGSITVAIPAKTNISNIYISTVSGSPTVSCGTSGIGSTEIFANLTPTVPIIVQQFFVNSTTLYITIVGGIVNIQIDAETINI